MNTNKDSQWKVYLGVVAGYLLSAVFLFSGVVKLMDIDAFTQDISNFRLLPDGMVMMSAWGVVLCELGCGVGVLFQQARKWAGYALAALLVIFSGAILSAWFRGLDIECGCFGKVLPDFGYTGILIRNGLLIALTIPLILYSGRQDTHEK